MGLDIYHYKLTTQHENNEKIFCRELSSEITKSYGFSSYRYKKRVKGFFSLIALFKNNQDFEKGKLILEKSNSEYEDFRLVTSGSFEDNLDKILKLEKSLELSEEKRELHWETTGIDGEEIDYLSIYYECELEQEIYSVEECGYQRKGMSLEFYQYFENCCYYADESSFKKLLTFCDPNNHMYDPKNIEENFINNYEEGRSILLFSW